MRQSSLLEKSENQPLAARLRPRDLDEYIGQKRLLEEGCVLRNLIEEDNVTSMIFWGPPGVGKTTLARIIAKRSNAQFITFSAVVSGIKEIKAVMENAEENRQLGQKTILFIDEIHRFNKAQQDAFLPYVEKGSIILIGATTENPSFELNGALLSRCQVFVLEPLNEEDLLELLNRALKDERAYGKEEIIVSQDILKQIAIFASGDGRRALTALETLYLNAKHQQHQLVIDEEVVEKCLGKRALLYDKNGEEHYNLISALHKSMRNSDPDAAVYWLTRMLEGGEDPIYIIRRVSRFASEDIGLADPFALEVAINAFEACKFIGMPECGVTLAEAVIYMSLAPKSNSTYMAYEKAMHDSKYEKQYSVPLHIRNAPTKLMKDLHYGEGYQYAHDYEEKMTPMSCLPEEMADKTYYEPGDLGREAQYKERLQKIKEWKEQHK